MAMQAANAYDQILSNKPVHLSSPGTKYSDLYFSEMNSSVEVIESTCNWQNKISLTSLNFGANNQVNMPLSCFVGSLVLHLQLPPISGGNQTLARGWGLRMIKQLRFQMGSATSTPIILTQAGIWHSLIASCITREKRSQLLELCGQAVTIPQPSTTVGGATPQPAINEAFVPIPVPFSTICEKLMFDTTLLGQPITVFIDFEANPSAIYGGIATAPASFQIAELMVRQQVLSDASKSMRNLMLSRPDLHYTYPFIMSLGYQTNGNFAGARPVDGVCSVQFNQFQNSDLLAIAFSVQKVLDLYPLVPNPPNPFRCDKISNIQVTYNGSMLFQLPGQAYKAISCFMGNQQSSDYDNVYISSNPATPGISPFVTQQGFDSLVILDFTNLRSACMQDHLYNTWRVPPGNVLNVTFNTSEGPSTQYQCHYTCFYNAAVDISAGTANIMTS